MAYYSKYIHQKSLNGSYNYSYNELPYIVYWFKNKYRDWPECTAYGANMDILQKKLDRAWVISTKYGYTYLPNPSHPYKIFKCSDLKKDILHTIKKKHRKLACLISTRKIGVLGFYIASFI